MGTLTNLTKTVTQPCVKQSKTCGCKPSRSQSLLKLLISGNFNITNSQFLQYQSRGTLILDSASSESVKLQPLSDSDSGIFEVNLNRPAARNALGTDMFERVKACI